MGTFELINSRRQFSWTCGYCQRPQIVTPSNSDLVFKILNVGELESGELFSTGHAIRCLNSDCNKLTFGASLHKIKIINQRDKVIGDEIKSWTLLPQSRSKPQPDYIPQPLRDDYYEACAIRDLSPKASATLSRRCLQGMIRDFCGIAKARLIDEIRALKAAIDAGTAPAGVSAETIDAIDSVRSVGNIGAHMEKDINVIVDVDPDEAQILIELLEMLFEDWYVARNLRKERLAKVTKLANTKKADADAAKSTPPAKPEGS